MTRSSGRAEVPSASDDPSGAHAEARGSSGGFGVVPCDPDCFRTLPEPFAVATWMRAGDRAASALVDDRIGPVRRARTAGEP